MANIPVTFRFKKELIHGYLSKVSGGGGASLFHLYGNNYYMGQLNLTQQNEWRFTSNLEFDNMDELSEYFGEVVRAWYE